MPYERSAAGHGGCVRGDAGPAYAPRERGRVRAPGRRGAAPPGLPPGGGLRARRAHTAVAGFRLLRTLFAGDVLYVDDLSTLPEARGRGHAGALLDWCAEEGRRLGATRCTWTPGSSPSARTRIAFTSASASGSPRTTSPARCGGGGGGGEGGEVTQSSLSALPPAADTLRRTPLYDRHEHAGARLVPFAGWEMPVQYEGIRAGAHGRADAARALRRLAHGRDRDPRAAGRGLSSAVLSNDVTKIAERGAQYSVLCREDGGVLDDLFTYRLGPDRFLTVTNASNHDKDLAWFTEHAAGFDVEVVDARRTGRCSPCRAPRRAACWSAWQRASCPRACAPPSCAWPAWTAWSAAPATPARTAPS